MTLTSVLHMPKTPWPEGVDPHIASVQAVNAWVARRQESDSRRRGGWPGPRGETLTVRIHPDLNARVRRFAGPKRGALKAVVTAAITEYLDRHDTEPEEKP